MEKLNELGRENWDAVGYTFVAAFLEKGDVPASPGCISKMYKQIV